jgi:hypothetical protein
MQKYYLSTSLCRENWNSNCLKLSVNNVQSRATIVALVHWRNLFICSQGLSNHKLFTVFLNCYIYLEIITKVPWYAFIRKNNHFLKINRNFSSNFQTIFQITFALWYKDLIKQKWHLVQILARGFRQKFKLWRQLWACITWYAEPCFSR